jgi:hypothetical protein
MPRAVNFTQRFSELNHRGNVVSGARVVGRATMRN